MSLRKVILLVLAGGITAGGFALWRFFSNEDTEYAFLREQRPLQSARLFGWLMDRDWFNRWLESIPDDYS